MVGWGNLKLWSQVSRKSRSYIIFLFCYSLLFRQTSGLPGDRMSLSTVHPDLGTYTVGLCNLILAERIGAEHCMGSEHEC